MRTLLIHFEDQQYEKLLDAKLTSRKTWREFLLSFVEDNNNEK